jgi:type I restriction enzyme S subunit
MQTDIKQKNIPDGWHPKKLANIFDFKNGLNKEKKFFGQGTPIINYMDVNRGGGLRAENILGRVEVNESELKRFSVKRGDVFFTRTSETLDEIGFSAVALDNFRDTVFSGFVLRARPTGEFLIPEYAQHCFKTQSARKEIMEKSSYTTRALTSGALLNHVNIVLPPLLEQKRIVAVLETWDQAITKLIEKIEIKKQIKKGLMQQLLTGNTRLPGFKGQWEELRIGNIGEVVTGNTPNTKISDYYDGPFLWATALDFNSVYIQDTEVKLSELGRRVAREVPAGSVLVTCIASIGKNAIANKSMSFNQQINAIIPNENFNSEFIYYLVENSLNKLKEVAGGGALAMINKSVFKSIKFTFPKKEEQLAIANILITADKEITELKEKLLLVNDQKKSLLNNLITGTIRTPETLKVKT